MRLHDALYKAARATNTIHAITTPAGYPTAPKHHPRTTPQQDRPMKHRVVRVKFSENGRAFSYCCPDCKIGDRVHADEHGTARVIGYGRRGYLGRLKPAHRVTT